MRMGAVSQLFESGIKRDGCRAAAAIKMTELWLHSGLIWFAIGTKINEAHQDPAIPVEFEIRRNVIKNYIPP